MQAIRNYLETMFMNLPNTPEVLRAKEELWQMMEDKYTELKNEGKSENEAVGTVISEFGNLDELAEELGIHQFMELPEVVAEQPRRTITMEDTKQFLHDKARQAFQVAFGVLLCIVSPVGIIISEAVHINELIGVLALFLCIAVAVGMFVFSGISIKKWDFLKQEPCSLDFETTNYVHEKKDYNRGIFALFLVIGIGLCILSVIPVIIFGEINLHLQAVDLESMGAAFLLLFVAIGVFLIVYGSMIYGSFDELLKVNDVRTVGGNYVPEQKEQYMTPAMATIMEVYWPTITCIYLIWSFLSFEWWVSWIIWPVAAIVHSILKSIFKK